MPINTNVTKDQITVAVGETQIDVNVSGGVGPTGNSGTIAVSAPVTNAGTSTAAVIGLSTGTGLAVSSGSLTVSYGSSAGVACEGNDARLSNAREWSAATVTQAEAEAGTSTSRFAFTPLRVFQAIAAWWAGSASKAKLDGIAAGATANAADAQLRDRATHTGTQLASTISDFTTAVVAAAPPTTNASLLTSGTLPDARLSGNIARTSDVSSAVASLVNSAPATLDTLAELASALGSDANFSTTVTNTLATKAPIASPTFTGTVSGITKSMVGLANVDNTSDLNKPISTATQAALDGKASLSHAHTVSDITGFSEAAQAAAAQRASRLGRNPYYYIPTENEWYKAAYYSPALNSGAGGYYTYATQSNSAPGTTPGGGANQANYANANGVLLDVGSFTNSASYYGTFDQSGNLFEWNDSTGTSSSSSRGARGGGAVNDAFCVSSSCFDSHAPTAEPYNLGFRLASPLNPLSLPNFVTVGNPGNANDSTGYGGVGYTYQIAKYELTNTEYCEFLNAVAATDTYGLLNSGMAITRSGSSGSYTYAPSSGNGNKPVAHITWFRAARYCNWLTNGKPSGSQTVFTTEDGAYTLNGATSGNAPARNALVTSVAGRTGAVTIAAADVSGLGTLATQSGTFSGTSSGTNTGDQTITLTGDVTGSGTGAFAATLAASGVTAGTYTSVTVDAKGRVTAGSNPSSGVKLGLILALQ